MEVLLIWIRLLKHPTNINSFLIISYLKRKKTFIWTELKALPQRMLFFSKFGWNYQNIGPLFLMWRVYDVNGYDRQRTVRLCGFIYHNIESTISMNLASTAIGRFPRYARERRSCCMWLYSKPERLLSFCSRYWKQGQITLILEISTWSILVRE